MLPKPKFFRNKSILFLLLLKTNFRNSSFDFENLFWCLPKYRDNSNNFMFFYICHL